MVRSITKRLLGTAALVAALFAGAQAQADTVTAQLLSINGSGVRFTNDSGANWTAYTNLGIFNWVRTDVPGPGVSPLPDTLFFQTYCIEIAEFTQVAPITWDFGGLTSAQVGGPVSINGIQALLLRELWFENWTPANAASGLWNAAFQSVVWEIVHETTVGPADLTTGNFQVDFSYNANPIAFAAIANGLLASLNDVGYSGLAGLSALTNNGLQDQVLAAVPLPSAAVAGAGLMGLMAIARRRKNKAAL